MSEGSGKDSGENIQYQDISEDCFDTDAAVMDLFGKKHSQDLAASETEIGETGDCLREGRCCETGGCSHEGRCWGLKELQAVKRS